MGKANLQGNKVYPATDMLVITNMSSQLQAGSVDRYNEMEIIIRHGASRGHAYIDLDRMGAAALIEHLRKQFNI